MLRGNDRKLSGKTGANTSKVAVESATQMASLLIIIPLIIKRIQSKYDRHRQRKSKLNKLSFKINPQHKCQSNQWNTSFIYTLTYLKRERMNLFLNNCFLNDREGSSIWDFGFVRTCFRNRLKGEEETAQSQQLKAYVKFCLKESLLIYINESQQLVTQGVQFQSF